MIEYFMNKFFQLIALSIIVITISLSCNKDSLDFRNKYIGTYDAVVYRNESGGYLDSLMVYHHYEYNDTFTTIVSVLPYDGFSVSNGTNYDDLENRLWILVNTNKPAYSEVANSINDKLYFKYPYYHPTIDAEGFLSYKDYQPSPQWNISGQITKNEFTLTEYTTYRFYSYSYTIKGIKK